MLNAALFHGLSAETYGSSQLLQGCSLEGEGRLTHLVTHPLKGVQVLSIMACTLVRSASVDLQQTVSEQHGMAEESVPVPEFSRMLRPLQGVAAWFCLWLASLVNFRRVWLGSSTERHGGIKIVRIRHLTSSNAGVAGLGAGVLSAASIRVAPSSSACAGPAKLFMSRGVAISDTAAQLMGRVLRLMGKSFQRTSSKSGGTGFGAVVLCAASVRAAPSRSARCGPPIFKTSSGVAGVLLVSSPGLTAKHEKPENANERS